MFLAVDQEPSGIRPQSSHIAPSDWRILSRFWYPVAVEGEVKQTPVKGKLLDVDLVIYRER